MCIRPLCINLLQVSNRLVRERLERENPEDVAILDDVKDSDIVCVRGTFDHIHLVLEAMDVPFTHVDPAALLRIDLKPEQTVYVNCPSSFPKEAAMKLRKFVEDGGQLITTDWALKYVLEVAFPGTVKFSGSSSGDEVVAVEIVDKEDDILKGESEGGGCSTVTYIMCGMRSSCSLPSGVVITLHRSMFLHCGELHTCIQVMLGLPAIQYLLTACVSLHALT